MATVLFAGHRWWIPSAVLFFLALVLLCWGYNRGAGGWRLRGVSFGFKLLGFFLLSVCLLEPLWTGNRVRPGANFFALLADNSQGMQIRDKDAAQSRGEMMRAELTDDGSPWQLRLQEDFQVRAYFFDTRLHQTQFFEELNFDGRATAMGAALRLLAERYQGRPLAGVLLFSDGNATDLSLENFDPSGLPPIYPVLQGAGRPAKDLALGKIAVSQTVFEDAPVTVQAEVSASGYQGQTIVAQLLDPSGTPRDEQTQRAAQEDQTLSFRFQMRPEHRGLLFYRLRVSDRAELGQFQNPRASTEATLANNSRALVIDRGQGPYRVLYLAGRPNWEYKFLQRALSEDEQVQLVGLIRVARREPKFDFRGRAGESSNPLFRGFDKKGEEIERYDEPVLVRLNTRDDQELRGGFPKTAEELFAYHALVVDDLEAEFFTHDQMNLAQKFVAERGGGFLMLGGLESFRQGNYPRTPIGQMLPIYLDRTPEGAPASSGWRFSLSRDGWLQPWARIRDNERDEKARLESMPPFQVFNRLRDLKPGATVIATASSADGRNYPALVVQRFGGGRVGALTIGDLWRWGLQDHQKELAVAWRQIVRWLIADVPNQVQLEAGQNQPEQPVLLQVRARDKNYQPLDNAQVQIQVEPVLLSGSGQSTNSPPAIRLQAEAVSSEAGLYQASFIPSLSGAYKADATVTDPNGQLAGRAQGGWTSDPAEEEFRYLKPNRALLEMIAKKTGGKLVAMEDLRSLVQSLPTRQAPLMETWNYPLWHRASFLLLAIGCFIAEWGLRRWKGLA